ncbi:Ribosome maturation factor RimM [Corynebacterium occultum]|uniref:Ribosome maturation factor RimM n=2 Tax=Corynebacterium occultum TaxID=2675219 RepID=A0A6B8WN00_9CORY|nr:Ribosome maturation factor RimM [Corynebacterium occultum]
MCGCGSSTIGALNSVTMELMIGRVVKSHGIRGEVTIEVTTDEPEIRYAVGEVLNGRQGRKEHFLTVKAARVHQGRLLVKFEEVPDRNAADSLRGTQFFATPLEREEEEDGFYDHELTGLKIVHEDAEIGEVTGVMHGPAGEILEVKLDNGKEVLIPFVHAIVPEVDLDSGTCTITPPEGLLEL